MIEEKDKIEEKETILRLLDVLFPAIKVYLFGSRARGTNRPSSDIDLALDFGRPLTTQEIARARRVVDALHMLLNVDIVDLNSVSKEFKEIILKEGKLWKS